MKRLIPCLVASLLATAAAAQTVKIGVINTFTGPQAVFGEMTDRAFKLYYKLHEKELGGVKLEFLSRDDGGPNPDKARQLAQELVVRDRVQLLAGVAFTPNAMAIAPVATEAKIPLILTNAGTSIVTTRSPYIARFSFTIWQSCVPLGEWAAKRFKRAYTLVSDYAPGHDAETAFGQGFKAGGGEIIGAVRVPLQNPDFAPYLQRVKDAKPDALFVFVPAGKSATALMKSFGELGLGQAGIKLIGPGDITTDEGLDAMGDVALDVITMLHYSAVGKAPANAAFVKAYQDEFGKDQVPAFEVVQGYDGMAAIFDVIKAQNGKIDPDKTMALLKGWKYDSARGPIMIDPETRDIIQTVYIRRVEKVDGALYNIEFDKFSDVKDPGK